MPEKDPYFWQYLLAIQEPIKGALAGFVVALLRIAYDDKEPRIVRRLLEASLCGVIALCFSIPAKTFGINGELATFIGGAIGLVGADQVRDWAIRIASKRIKGGDACEIRKP